MAEAVKTGKVKWFNSSKGFGFITPNDEGEDLFVHQSSIHAEGFRSLREGEDVEFSIENSDDGRTKALNVTGPNGSYVQGAPRRDSYSNGGGRGGRGGYGNGGYGEDSYGGGYGGGFGGRGGGRGRGRGGFGGPGGGEKSCYNCNESGHIARECPNPPSGNGGGGGGGRTCYNCNQPGHIARECPSAGGE